MAYKGRGFWERFVFSLINGTDMAVAPTFPFLP